MGWERKRGKLEELNAALRGDASRFATIVGPDRAARRASQYVITLDSDTQLPRDAARAARRHARPPAQPPVLRRSGAAASPRATRSCSRASASACRARARSRFARLFAGEPGIDPYTRAVSDVYQDVFGEGSFIGKGIYDVDALQRAIGGRLPENRVLSHDLLEGAYARAGLVSDVVLVRGLPVGVRRRRQPAPPLDPRRLADRALAAAARARRRRGRVAEPDLAAVAAGRSSTTCGAASCRSRCCALLVVGWLLPGAALLVDAAVVLAMLLAAGAADGGGGARAPAGRPAARPARCARSRARSSRQLVREAFALACLPYDALHQPRRDRAHAVRVLDHRRKLLEWRTASDAQRAARTEPRRRLRVDVDRAGWPRSASRSRSRRSRPDALRGRGAGARAVAASRRRSRGG